MARGLSKRNPGDGGGAGVGGVAPTYVRDGCVVGRGYAPDTRRTRPHAHTLRRSGLRPRHTANPATRPIRFLGRGYAPDTRRTRPHPHTLRSSGLRPRPPAPPLRPVPPRRRQPLPRPLRGTELPTPQRHPPPSRPPNRCAERARL